MGTDTSDTRVFNRVPRIRAWRSPEPPPPEVSHSSSKSSVFSIKGHAHLHPRGMKHKRLRIFGVKVR